MSHTPSLADPEIQENPYDYYDALRDEPIRFDDQLGVFVCSTYQEMRAILRDVETFSNVNSQTMDSLREPPAEVVAIRRSSHETVNTLVTNDPPSHTRVRKMVDEPFRPRSIEKLRGAIREIVNETLDALEGREVDFVRSFAIPIPVTVIADMLGVPRSRAGDIKIWSDASVEPLGIMVSDERLIECAKLIKGFQDYVVDELEQRRAAPRDDLLTRLVEARDDNNQPFTTAEMLSLTQQFLVAGNETTTNAIAAGVRRLAESPGLRAALRADRGRLLTFANEVLRLDSPVGGLFRVVTRDTQVAGVTLPAGSRVMLRFASANRDPGKYDLPGELDLHRANAGTHVAFGAGIHHCIGANLAREEMVQAFDVLLDRHPDFELAEGRNDFRHHPSLILRGLRQLWVKLP